MLGITIRVGAAYDQIVVADGKIIDRSTLDRSEKRKLTRLVVAIFSKHIERN